MAHLKPLVAEIHELGRELALLIGPGSSVERARRSEVRVLLREAFLATQDANDDSVLCAVRKRLVEARKELEGGGTSVESTESAEVDKQPEHDLGEEETEPGRQVSSGGDDQSDESAEATPGRDLADRLIRHRRFGSLDHAVGHRNSGFAPVGQTTADELARGIEKRVQCVLSHLTDPDEEAGSDDSPRSIKTQEENKELIVSKMS